MAEQPLATPDQDLLFLTGEELTLRLEDATQRRATANDEAEALSSARKKLGWDLAKRAADEYFGTGQVKYMRILGEDPLRYLVFVNEGFKPTGETSLATITPTEEHSTGSNDVYSVDLDGQAFRGASLNDFQESEAPTNPPGQALMETVADSRTLAKDLVRQLVQTRDRLEKGLNGMHNLLQQLMGPVVRELVSSVQADPDMHLEEVEYSFPAGIETIIVLDIPFDELPDSIKRRHILLENGAQMHISPNPAGPNKSSAGVTHIPEALIQGAELDLSLPQSERWTFVRPSTAEIRDQIRRWLG